jgi:hypothetical protein
MPRWLVVAVVAWGVALAAGVWWAADTGAPTAREQTTVAQALPIVDEATANIAQAATADGRAVVAISGFDRVGDCRITVVRRGARYQRIVTVLVPPGAEAAALDRVAAGLPKGYGAAVRHGAVPRLTADAGFFVGISGGVAGSGQLRFVVDTGNCRGETVPLAPGPERAGPPPASAGDPPASLRAPIEAVLTALRVGPAEWTTHVVACPDGTLVRSAQALGEPGAAPADRLDDALRDQGETTILAAPDAVAYRSGPVGVSARVVDDRLVVTATTVCAP